ncbi:hypothetical protein V2J09_000635 [Rumex salicifolius]
MIGASYLTIQRWRPNFVAEEETIKFITSWIRIPNLSMEYFDTSILTQIGNKLERVLKIDKTTSATKRERYTCMSVEIDVIKPLLSMFYMNGRIWKIQYEGLRMDQSLKKQGPNGNASAHVAKNQSQASGNSPTGTKLRGGNSVEGPQYPNNIITDNQDKSSGSRFSVLAIDPNVLNLESEAENNSQIMEVNSKKATGKELQLIQKTQSSARNPSSRNFLKKNEAGAKIGRSTSRFKDLRGPKGITKESMNKKEIMRKSEASFKYTNKVGTKEKGNNEISVRKGFQIKDTKSTEETPQFTIVRRKGVSLIPSRLSRGVVLVNPKSNPDH